jgi:hypothetical protein
MDKTAKLDLIKIVDNQAGWNAIKVIYIYIYLIVFVEILLVLLIK